jgi:hypothetical protein
MNRLISVLLLLSFLPFLSCEKYKVPVGYDFSKFVYPLEIGNRWEYDRIFISYNFRPDSIKNQIGLLDTIKTFSTVAISKQEWLKDSILTYQIVESLTEYTTTVTSESYYFNLEDGLYLLAYKGAGSALPKQRRSNKFIFRGLYFNNLTEISDYFTRLNGRYKLTFDSLYYENPPLQIIKYPLEEGLQWTLRKAGEPFRIDRRVLSEQNIQVPAGNYRGIKIQNLYDLDGDNEWDESTIYYDYISNKGLLKRSILIKDVIVADDSGQVIGLVDVRDELNLIKVMIN